MYGKAGLEKLWVIMFSLFYRFVRETRGSIAMITAVTIFVVLLVVGVAADLGRLQSQSVKSQSLIDGATLAAAKYMSDTITSDDNQTKREKAAKEVAELYISELVGAYDFKMEIVSDDFTDEEVTLVAQVNGSPILMDLFGVDSLDSKVTSSATLAGKTAKDVDVVLIADITGSMAMTLTAVQENMKDFTWDLSSRLTANNIKMGRVRVQFIFYRDYAIDNHQNWTGPDMTPVAGMELDGPMYISKFYDVPAEKVEMDTYVDFFAAGGGGSFAESGLETVWHALNTDWRDSEKTVRSVVLWTDASARQLHDKTEASLTPSVSTHVPPAEPYWWTNEYFEQTMGAAFAAMTKEQREDYNYNNFYPADMPASIDTIKSTFADFHDENSNSVDGVTSMAINVIRSTTVDPITYPTWTDMATWDGINVIGSDPSILSDDAYEKILDQVVEMVTSQVVASELVISH